jgi:protein O-mannosyl-transferase
MKSESQMPNQQDPNPPEVRSDQAFSLQPLAFSLCLLLVLVTLLVYLPAWRHQFLRFDDADYVTDNGMVQSGLTWAGAKWAFTTFHSSNWHPLTWLSHMLDATLFGPGPTGPHGANVLLHVANTVLLFLLLGRLTQAVWRSALVAALFALHPLHVESVAWVAERKDLLSGMFFLLSVLAYTSYVSYVSHKAERSLRFYLLSLFFFALGLLSKPMLVTLPLVLLLLDYWPLRRFTIYDLRFTIWPLIREKVPFLVLSIVSCVITYQAQQQGGAVRSLASFPLDERIGNAAVAYARYLGKVFWPVDLAVFYPHPGQWPPGLVLLAAALLAGLCLLVLRYGRRFPYAVTGWFWFLGMLIPVIGLVQVSNQSMADRYTYLPSIGLFIVLAWGAGELVDCRRRAKALAGIAAGLVVVACAVQTRGQLRYWRDGESLFRHALAVTGRNFVAHNNLGNVLLDQGHVDEAIAHYQRALEIQPRYADAGNNLGSALLEKGQVDEAIAWYQKALELQPDYALAHNNLGNALLRKGQVDEAIAQYCKTLALQPDYASAWNNLATALRKKGQLDEAIIHYRKALELNPCHARGHNNLGDVLLQMGRPDEAMAHFKMAVKIQPDFADARHNLGVTLMQRGRVDEAAVQFQKVVELKPGDAEARNNLGWCLMQTGRVDEGIAQFQKALEIQPGFAEAHSNLGFGLLQNGRVREAMAHLQTAVTVQPDNARTLSGLAWVLATCPDASVRNGTKAVELAERANQLAGGQDPLILRSLAAACAEAGRIAEAVTTARRALQLAEARSDTMLADMLRSEMKLYQAGSPFRDVSR